MHHSPRSARGFTLAGWISLLVPFASHTAVAQGPSNWTTTSLPASVSGINSIGTTTTVRTPSEIWLYSGITKRWLTVPASPAATLFQANDYCVVVEGRTLHGFASHIGRVETIQVPLPPTVVSGPASSSWVTLVASGTTVYGFGAFRGEWTSTPIATANPTMVANRLLGLVDDGTSLLALSAHHGDFVSIASGPGAVLSVIGEGEIGTAHSPATLTAAGTFRAFSAQQNNWVTQPLPPGSSTLQSNEYALAWIGNLMWACSGLTGTLATYAAAGTISTVVNAEGCAAFFDGVDAVCYGAGRGEFAAMPATNPAFQQKYHYVLVRDGSVLTPFSAITCTFGAPLTGSFGSVVNDEVAFVDGGAGQGFAYSAPRNLWAAAPAGLAPFNSVAVRDSIVLAHNSGYTAFSGRYGTWVPLTTTTTYTFTAPANSSSFVANDVNNTLHVFDARLNRWASVTGTATMTTKISRHTVMAHDDSFAYGFGQPSGEWHVVPLTQAPSSFDTASSIGTLVHGNELSIYSVQGSLSYTGRYPEFTQAINLGGTLRMHQVAPAGSLVVQIVGDAPAFLPLPGLGTLFVAPATAFTLLLPTLVDADGLLDITIPIPNNPALVGFPLHLQDIVLEPAGNLWLSSSVAPFLF